MSYVSTETVCTTDHLVDHYELVHLEFHNRGGLETLWLDVVLWLWTTALALDEWYKQVCAGHEYLRRRLLARAWCVCCVCV